MSFGKVIKLMLIFFGLAKKYADQLVSGTIEGCIVYVSNNALNITTTTDEETEG